ncbi:hypothetical protein WMY93_014948 [Mugilogobius chulae]|uniref:Membrane-spanning 4-domains subfamily A member 4A-like n=1 Tax=Mugilogobius chulae TaxID=88201 RepID=A0AAW0NYB2_9GOBI
MTDADAVEAGPGVSNNPLVSVSFQRDEQRKQKFLEGEPKALGITQVNLIIFHTCCIAVMFGNGVSRDGLEIYYFVSSGIIFAAGILAILSKNLKIPMLRACVGMELVSSVISIFNLILTASRMGYYNYCYYYHSTEEDRTICKNEEAARMHLLTELVIIELVLFAISVTLMIYACKVANCCSVAPKVPVITIQAPPAAQ